MASERIIATIMKKDDLKAGPIRVTVFKPVNRLELGSRDFLDVVAEYSERYRNDKNVLILVRSVNEHGEIIREAVIYNGGRSEEVLFPSPARLQRIILVESGRGIRNSIDVGENEVYVYMGNIVVNNSSIAGVVLVTDKGARPLLKLD